MNTPPPRRTPFAVNAAAAELGRALRELASKPHAARVLRGLDATMPETAATVRAALEAPGEVIAGVVERTLLGSLDAGAAELRDADQTIARGLARAFGRGVGRALVTPPPAIGSVKKARRR